MLIFNRYLIYLIIPFFYWVYSYNAIYRDGKANMRIVVLSLPFILYPAISTIYALIEAPYVARAIKTSGETSDALRRQGIEGYSLIYSSVLLVIASLPLLVERKRIEMKRSYYWLILAMMIILIILIVLSNYFTALLVLLFGMISMLLLYHNRKAFLFILPLLLLYAVFNKPINMFILETAVEWFPEGGRTHYRLQEISKQMRFGIGAMGVNSRSEVTRQSLKVIGEYPLQGYVLGNKSSYFNFSVIGQHSHILDTFALFGVFVGFFVLWVLWLPFKYRVTKKASYKQRIYAWIMGGSFLILNFANLLVPTMGYAAFFVFPTIYDYINSKNSTDY